MFVPKLVLEYFGVNAELVRNLQSDLASIRTEKDLLKQELTSSKINNDWLRIQFNDLQRQNKALLEKAYNIKLEVPEIQPSYRFNPTTLEQFSFEDMGNDKAKEQGLPVYE